MRQTGVAPMRAGWWGRSLPSVLVEVAKLATLPALKKFFTGNPDGCMVNPQLPGNLPITRLGDGPLIPAWEALSFAIIKIDDPRLGTQHRRIVVRSIVGRDSAFTLIMGDSHEHFPFAGSALTISSGETDVIDTTIVWHPRITAMFRSNLGGTSTNTLAVRCGVATAISIYRLILTNAVDSDSRRVSIQSDYS